MAQKSIVPTSLWKWLQNSQQGQLLFIILMFISCFYGVPHSRPSLSQTSRRAVDHFSCLLAGKWEQEMVAIEEASNQWTAGSEFSPLTMKSLGRPLWRDVWKRGGWWETGMLFIIIRHCLTPEAGRRISALGEIFRDIHHLILHFSVVIKQ